MNIHSTGNFQYCARARGLVTESGQLKLLFYECAYSCTYGVSVFECILRTACGQSNVMVYRKFNYAHATDLPEVNLFW